MTFKPYPIVPILSGLETDRAPFLLPDDAFPQLQNCYLYKGRIERRIGNELLGRLVEATFAVALGNTAVSPSAFNIITSFPAAVLGISPGSTIITIAAPIGPLIFLDNGDGTLTAPGPFTGTINYVTGAVTLNHPAGAASAVTADFEYYTGRPVMGLPTEETTALSREDLKAFDTRKANLFNNAFNRFVDISFDLATGAAIQWNGGNANFFWSWNYYQAADAAATFRPLFWTTNNIQNTQPGGVGTPLEDGIQIYNELGWTAQRPQLTAVPTYLRGCLILVSYRNRMVALNTLESAAGFGASTRYANRARWSQNGVPFTDGNANLVGADANAWRDDLVGRGGYIDAPTSEQIVSCGFYKDTLIVFFERSTWQLFYSGNETLPFIWQRINTQWGCESTHAVVGFDKGLFAVGNTAIIMSDSVTVDRIDLKIPTEVFEFHNQNDGPIRVHGIRDYFYQFVYWTFPNSAQNGTYPNRVLALNYLDGSYSFYDDSYTCFGYYQSFRDLIWSRATFAWIAADPSSWTSAQNQADFPSVVGGNQQGFVMILDQKTSNDPTLYITNITQAVQAVVTSPNHNLQRDQYVKFVNVLGMVGINNLVGKIVSFTANTFTVDIDTTAMAAWTAGGNIIVINTYDVVTKKFNPFYQAGQKVRASYADFFVERTTAGAFTVDFLVDDSYDDPINTLVVATSKEYGPSPDVSKIWQRAYTDVMGQYLQMHFYLSDDQIRNSAYQEVDPSKSDIVIHAVNFWMAPSGRLQSYDMV